MLSTLLRRTACLTTTLGLGWALVGCPDPGGSFDDFTERKNQIDQATGTSTGTGTGGGAPCVVPMAGEADGDFLFALSAKISPKKPVLFLATVTTPADASAGGGIDVGLVLQPLDAADRKTPVGAALDLGQYPVDAEGHFVAALPTLTVEGAANPISGSLLEATVTLTGSICAPADFVCGQVTGSVAQPIPINDLTGSTFAMSRIEDPNAYPPAIYKCDGTVSPPP